MTHRLFSNVAPPNLPAPTGGVTPTYINQLNNVLRLFFTSLTNVQQMNVSAMNTELDTLPTDADFATLRSGDVYRDTSDGSLRTVDGNPVGAGARSNKVLLWLSM